MREVVYRPYGELPRCSYPVATTVQAHRPVMCGALGLYAFRMGYWPAHQKAAVCAGHARHARTIDGVECMWLATQPTPPRGTPGTVS